MNRKNVIRAFIQYFSYWIRVVTRAISHTVVIVGGFFTIVLTVGIPFFLSVQSKPYVSVAELLQREDMGTAVPFLVIGIIVVIFYFSIVPVQLYIEQEKKLNTLKFEKQQLIESVQPKLDLCFDDTNATSRFALGNNQTLFRFRVKNISIAENV